MQCLLTIAYALVTPFGGFVLLTGCGCAWQCTGDTGTTSYPSLSKAVLCFIKLCYRTLEEIELRARQLSAHRIERNVHAMQCRVMLWQGRLEEAEHWMDQKPADDLTFNSLDRYCYLTRVRVYMAKERYDRATTLLTRLTQYADRTDRQWIQMECGLLRAIVRYRTGDEAWQPQLLAVLQRAEAYHFVRLFSREGSALLELLRELQDTGKAGGAFFAEVLAKTSRLAEAYPGYLRQSAGALAVIFAKNIQKEPGSFVLPGSLDAVEKISPRT